MAAWESILKPGLHLRGGQEFVGTNEMKRVLLGDADVQHFERMSLLIWSAHPDVMYRIAFGQWKQRRREAALRGVSFDEAAPSFEDYSLGRVVMPAPMMLAEFAMKKALMAQQPIQRQVAPEPTPVAQAVPVAQPTELDNSKVDALKQRFMRFAYKSLDTFAGKVGEDKAYIRQVGKDWPAEKARAKD